MLKNNINAIKRNIKKYKKSVFFRAKFEYTKYYDTLEIQDKSILICCYLGNNLSGNGYQLLKTILADKELTDYRIAVAVYANKTRDIKQFLEGKDEGRIEIVEIHSKEYLKCLASFKYLINNVTFPMYFIKKEGQIYINTWHGTPLKNLGKAVNIDPEALGNSQRNFMMSDYLFYPNLYTRDIMIRDYMIEEGYRGKVVVSGYPRNIPFLDSELQADIREKLDLVDTEIICYMPTWRGSHNNKLNQQQYINIMFYLLHIDKHLTEDKIMYVNLHSLVNDIVNFKMFKHIKPFPEQYETYEFLSIADCLVTDYSSVFFDFALTRRKIILFAYDKKEYFAERGVYQEIDDLPFPIALNLEQLFEALEDVSDYRKYDDFVETYCSYETMDTSQNIVDMVFKNKIIDEFDVTSCSDNGKENVLIFGGGLLQNGITTALYGLLENIDTTKKNYTLLFYARQAKGVSYLIHSLPKGINYIPIQGQRNLRFLEAIANFFYSRFHIEGALIRLYNDRIYEREVKRLFGNRRFDHVIHFSGYEYRIALLFGAMKNSFKTIYVHNNMVKERNTRSNYHVKTIFEAYNRFDFLAGVRDGIKEELTPYLKEEQRKKIHVVHNANRIDNIRERSKLEIEFEDNTWTNFSLEEIKEILNDKTNLKFINIGRFSPEKGQERLIEAFHQIYLENPKAYLIINGGNESMGMLKRLQAQVEELENPNVIFIKYLINPFPILAKTNALIMSSYYEGLPMTIMEALILDIPVVSTDITGPREFLSQGYGTLVEDSTEGILEGLRMVQREEVSIGQFDAEKFNENAVEEFYEIFK